MKLIVISALILSSVIFGEFQKVTQKKIQVKEQYIQVVSENSSEILFIGK